jgi:hypothetical protein
VTRTDGPPRAVFIAAIAVALAVLVGVLVVAANREPAPVPIAAVPAPKASDPACTSLLSALPDSLGDFEHAEAAPPAPEGTAAWRAGEQTVILRCGLDRPVDFVVGAPLQMVDDVTWFRVAEADRITWFAVDRPVYVALTLPENSGPAPIQQVSKAISETLPAKEIDPAPVG